MPPRIPTATYRLQFNHHFTLKDALRLVPYFHSLGISDLYCSPLLKAVPSSLHGYDQVDPAQLNPEIGTEEDLAQLAAALQERHMGILLDIVPNHMSISDKNPWWQDVLRMVSARSIQDILALFGPRQECLIKSFCRFSLSLYKRLWLREKLSLFMTVVLSSLFIAKQSILSAPAVGSLSCGL